MSDRTRETLSRMVAIMAEARPLIEAGGTANLERLRPIRLAMAGTMTSFQLALHALLLTRSAVPEAADLAKANIIWNAIGIEFRTFTARHQDIENTNLATYRREASAFMARIENAIGSIDHLIPKT